MCGVIALYLLHQVLYLHLLKLVLLIESLLVLLDLFVDFFIFFLIVLLLLPRLFFILTRCERLSLCSNEGFHEFESTLTRQVLVQRVIVMQCDLGSGGVQLLMHLEAAETGGLGSALPTLVVYRATVMS